MRFALTSVYRARFTSRPDPSPAAFQAAPTFLEYRPVSGGRWRTADGVARRVPDTDRVVHTVEVTGLTPDTMYEFRTAATALATYLTWSGDPTSTMVVHWHTRQPLSPYLVLGSPVRRFRTMPTTLDTLRIAQIGDTHGDPNAAAVFTALAARDPRFVLHPGDIANADGGSNPPDTWYSFFDTLQHAVDTSGCIIPIIPTIGNHEVLGGGSGAQWAGAEYGNKPDFDAHTRGDAEWYYSFFPAFPGLTGYGLLDFGDYLSVWALDPGISTRWDEGQLDWLNATLAARQHVPHRLVNLHYGPWPAGRRVMANYYRDTQPVLCPILEDRGVRLVLTGHEHVLSRTVPITGGSYLAGGADGTDLESGVVYVGAGPGGAAVRDGRNPHTKWWIHDSRASEWVRYDFEIAPANPLWDETREPHVDDGTTFTDAEVTHFWEVDLTPSGRTVRAIDGNGATWDEFTQDADPSST